MEMTELNKFINENMHVLIPALWVLGYVMKTMKAINDTYIPIILIFLGILMASGIQGFSMNAVIQGILVAGATIGIHQGYKQIFAKPKKEEV